MVFLFDENVPYKFVEGLACIEYSNKSPIKATVLHPKFIGKEGALDQEVIKIAGIKKATIISFDKDFKHIKSYYPLYKEHKVGVVFLSLSKKDYTYWGIVKLIINHWEELKEKLSDLTPPYVYQLDKKGIQKFDF